MAKKIVAICKEPIVEGFRQYEKGATIILDPQRFAALGTSVELCKELRVVQTPAGDTITKVLKAQNQGL